MRKPGRSHWRLRRLARRTAGIALGSLVIVAILLGDRLGLFGRRPSDPGGDYARYHGQSFRVVRVVDGDTLDIDAPDGGRSTTRIRLWGVDTPETKHPTRPVQHFGPEAEAFTRRLCEGRTVRLELLRRPTRGSYGRLLAYVFLPDGTMLNRQLVRLGYAWADPRFEHPRRGEFERLQAEARAARRGLWRNARPEDLPHYYRETLAPPSR